MKCNGVASIFFEIFSFWVQEALEITQKSKLVFLLLLKGGEDLEKLW